MAILTIGKGGAECRKSARLGPRGEVSGISRAALPSIGGGARCRASAGLLFAVQWSVAPHVYRQRRLLLCMSHRHRFMLDLCTTGVRHIEAIAT